MSWRALSCCNVSVLTFRSASHSAITYIVTGKRHHISIFPKLPADGDRTGNVKAGTIVDTEVTHPFQFDFYLQSHASLLGTSRSAHYTVIYDDNKFSADVLQQLTFNL